MRVFLPNMGAKPPKAARFWLKSAQSNSTVLQGEISRPNLRADMVVSHVMNAAGIGVTPLILKGCKTT